MLDLFTLGCNNSGRRAIMLLLHVRVSCSSCPAALEVSRKWGNEGRYGVLLHEWVEILLVGILVQ